jgi:hypothetical protein
MKRKEQSERLGFEMKLKLTWEKTEFVNDSVEELRRTDDVPPSKALNQRLGDLYSVYPLKEYYDLEPADQMLSKTSDGKPNQMGNESE